MYIVSSITKSFRPVPTREKKGSLKGRLRGGGGGIPGPDPDFESVKGLLRDDDLRSVPVRLMTLSESRVVCKILNVTDPP